MKTVLMLADQMIGRIEYVHNKNFIHRYILILYRVTVPYPLILLVPVGYLRSRIGTVTFRWWYICKNVLAPEFTRLFVSMLLFVTY